VLFLTQTKIARSGVAFCSGFESDAPSAPFVSMEPKIHDMLLRPFKRCAPYVRSLTNRTLLSEHRKFAKSFFPPIAARVSKVSSRSKGEQMTNFFKQGNWINVVKRRCWFVLGDLRV
jgi:hypothetical protein